MHKLIVVAATTFFIFILWIIYLANTGSSCFLFGFVRSFPYGDKVGHFCLFGALTFGAIVGSRFRSFSLWRIKIYYAAVFVTIFVIGEELSQAFIPTRRFDLIDLTADALGIFVAIVLAYVVDKQLLKRGRSTP